MLLRLHSYWIIHTLVLFFVTVYAIGIALMLILILEHLIVSRIIGWPNRALRIVIELIILTWVEVIERCLRVANHWIIIVGWCLTIGEAELIWILIIIGVVAVLGTEELVGVLTELVLVFLTVLRIVLAVLLVILVVLVILWIRVA